MMLIEPTVKIARSNRLNEYTGATTTGYTNEELSWEEFMEGCISYAYVPAILDHTPLSYPFDNDREIGSWKMKGFTLGYSNVIALDVDNNTMDGTQVSIENFKERFRFKYYLITTKSHLKEKAKGKDRYRVWIPLKDMIHYQDPKDYAKAITHLGSLIGLTTADDKLDNRDVVMGSYQPKFERSPTDAYTYESEYDNLLDFSKVLKLYHPGNIDNKTMEAEGNRKDDITYATGGEILKDYKLTTEGGEEMMLNDVRETTTIYCPICEGNSDEHKTPSATAYYKEDGANSFYCWKNSEHQRFTQYKNTGGFKDETK